MNTKNSIRKITTLSMLTALVGAILLMDKIFGFILADFSSVTVVAVLFICATIYELNDCLILSFCLFLIELMLGNAISFIYGIVGIITGVLVSLYVIKNRPKINIKKLIVFTVFIYFISELAVSIVIYPLFSLGTPDRIIEFITNKNIVTFIGIINYIAAVFCIALFEGAISVFLGVELKKRIRV